MSTISPITFEAPDPPERLLPREGGGARDLATYFLKLGTVGFGGPIALVGYMHRDLVEQRKWFTEDDYSEALALAQLAPGPLAAQLAIYLGWIKAGMKGATAVALAFVFPSFLMVLALSAAYIAYGGLPWMQGAFYGVGAAVIAIILRSVIKLVKTTLGKERLLWAIFLVLGVVTAVTQKEVIWLFIGSGILYMLVKSPPKKAPSAPAISMVPAWMLAGLHGVASGSLLLTILGYFATAGAFVFGSGLAVVPFLHGGVVAQYHWLNERQFLDAVAVAMITPGPVVITVAFIGYLVAGPLGAVMAAIGVFLPCYLCVVICARYFRKATKNPSVKAFVSGVTAAATGAIGGSAVILATRAVTDIPTGLICAAAFLALTYGGKKVQEPVLIGVAALLGIGLKTVLG